MVSLNAVPVAYDPDNRRVFHVEGGPVVDFWLPNGEKLMTLGVVDDPYQGAGAVEFVPVRKYFWFGGRMEGSKGSGNSHEWLQPDRLGSHARVYPYGEEMAATTTSYKFATYQRGGGGLDYAMNRYYSPVYGRFTSADPYRASAGPSDPGSWNRYAYVQGDPVNFNDPQGLLACGVDTPNSINVCDSIPGSTPGGSGAGSEDMQDGAQDPSNGDTPGSGGGTVAPLFVTEFSDAGVRQDVIKGVFSKVRDALPSDGDCVKWLRNPVFSASDLIDTLLSANTFGHADFGPSVSISAVAGSRNADGSPTGIPTTSAITVNREGAFFSSHTGAIKLTVGPRDYEGGTLKAQAQILIHELAHFLGAAGFLPDFGKPDAVKRNNELVDKNCGRLIRRLK